MERRRLMFMGLAGFASATFGLAATAKAGILGDASGLARVNPMGAEALSAVHDAPGETLEDGIVLAQHHRHPHRGRRCWNETRHVRYRDRHGRIRTRRVTQRVCR